MTEDDLTIGPLTITEVQSYGIATFDGPKPPPYIVVSMTFWPYARGRIESIKSLLELVGKRVEITVKVLEDADE